MINSGVSKCTQKAIKLLRYLLLEISPNNSNFRHEGQRGWIFSNHLSPSSKQQIDFTQKLPDFRSWENYEATFLATQENVSRSTICNKQRRNNAHELHMIHDLLLLAIYRKQLDKDLSQWP